MNILYCKKWWFARKTPIDILDEIEAQYNHNNGLQYCVVISEGGINQYILEISQNDIFVNFINDSQHRYLTYAFHRERNDDIFLNATYYHNYEEGIEKELIIFGFKTNGELLMEKRNLISGDVEEKESKVDVSGNWDKYPIFGSYTSLIKLNRM